MTETVAAVGNTVLVGIDLQEIFANPASQWSSPDYGTAARGTLKLLPHFQGRTVLTRFVAPPKPWGSWVPYYQQWSFALVPDSDPLYAFTPEFADFDGPVVTREAFGKWGPELHKALNGADTMILTGVSTDCCVLSTALAAADAGITVKVVADACAGVSPADHQRALDAMAMYAPLITVTTVKEVLAQAGADH